MPLNVALVRVDPWDPAYAEIVPELAESWQIGHDGLTYTFKLVEAYWHDGEPVTADDVRFTLDTIRTGRGLSSNVFGARLANVESIETEDARTVVVRLKKPQAAFLYMLGHGWTIMIQPEHVYGDDPSLMNTARPIGAGPFRFVEHKVGESVTIERNPNYFRKELPYLDGVEFIVIPDASARHAALLTGRIHTTRFESGTAAQEIPQQEPRIRGQTLRKDFGTNLHINVTEPPWDDVRIRTALHLAINRDEFVQLWDPFLCVPAWGIFHPVSPFKLPKERLEKIPGFWSDYDKSLEEARKLLAEAGYPEGMDVTILNRDHELYRKTSVIFVEMLGRIGVRAELYTVDSATYYDRVFHQEFGLAIGDNPGVSDEPDLMFFEKFLCGANNNYAGFCSPEIDERIMAQSMESDPDKRRNMIHALIEDLLNLHVDIMPAWIHEMHGLWDFVRDYPETVQSNAGRLLDRVWLDKTLMK